MKNAALFTRHSGDDAEGNEQKALERQICAIEAYVAQLNLRIVDGVAELGISARKLRDRVLSFLHDHPDVRTIITYIPDRLFRSLDDFGASHAALAERACGGLGTFWSKALPDRFLPTTNAVASQNHLELVRLVKRGTTRKAAQGTWPSNAPFGYLNVLLPSGQRGIVPDKQSANSVRRLFNRCAMGALSLRQIAVWARKAGLTLNRSGWPS